MMLAASLISFTAQSDIYRCVSNDGVVQFSDQPCSGVSAQVLRKTDDDNDSETRLREWLQELKVSAPAQSSSNRTPNGVVGVVERFSESDLIQALPQLPGGGRGFEACSSQFFSCAGSNAEQMDDCVATIPVCRSNRLSGCCESAYIGRYGVLRQSGASRQSAVRNALLGLDSEKNRR